MSADNLTNDDFSAVDFLTGGPITFGFGMVTQSFGTGGDMFDGEQFDANFDNFRVEIHLVPVPAAWILLASALLPLVRRRDT